MGPSAIGPTTTMSPRSQGPKSAWNLLQASRRCYSLGGVSAPSSRNLWDIVKRAQFENHDAKHVHDIWMEVGRRCIANTGVWLLERRYPEPSLPTDHILYHSSTPTHSSTGWQT